MSEPIYLKCQCQQCGGHIEFPADAAGQTVACPHCAWQTVLSVPATSEETPQQRNNRKWIIAIVGAAAVLLVGAAIAFVMTKRPAARSEQHASADSRMATTNVSIAKRVIPKNVSRISTNNFSVSRITLDKPKGGALIYAVGTVTNESEKQRFGVKVELELLDDSGWKIGTATDYQQVLEPNAEWRFKALVLVTNAISAKLAWIKEDK